MNKIDRIGVKIKLRNIKFRHNAEKQQKEQEQQEQNYHR